MLNRCRPARTSSLRYGADIGERTQPGATTLTVMPWAPSSRASERVMPMMAPLLAT
jgi:hypothetical protein